MEDVEPVNPIAPYIGGKSKLAKTIISIIDTVPHITYAEPFVGMGGIFFRRSKRPKSEVINDINQDLITLFRVIQRFYPYFKNELRFRLASRAEFERLTAQQPDTLLDLERAARFLYLQRLGFGGKVAGRNFGVCYEKPSRFNVSQLIPYLEDLNERLQSVLIECKPYYEFIPQFDRDGTLFFLDPPYWNSENYYGKGIFNKADYDRLNDILMTIKGKFILTINDVPEIRDTFKSFNFQKANVPYTFRNNNGLIAKELIITNF